MSEKLKGGLSDGLTIEDIAKKHKVSIKVAQEELERGMSVEKEHASDESITKEIAMDHLFEDIYYYKKLSKMEKKEPKECTGADASGSVEAPIFGKTILKKDIHKINNFKSKNQEIDEVTGADVSAGAMYDAPIGHKTKDPLKLDNVGKSASITASRDTRAVKDKNFPKFGGPDAKFVEIDSRCKKYPYCNQGADNQLKLYEIKGMKEAIQEAAKKYGIAIKEVRKLVSEALPRGMFDDEGNKRAMRGWIDKGPNPVLFIKTQDPIHIQTDDDVDIAKLKLLFYKYDIKFHDGKIKE